MKPNRSQKDAGGTQKPPPRCSSRKKLSEEQAAPAAPLKIKISRGIAIKPPAADAVNAATDTVIADDGKGRDVTEEEEEKETPLQLTEKGASTSRNELDI
jgi:hypothetical protein